LIPTNLKKEREIFESGLETMGLSLSGDQIEKNLSYLKLLLETNQEYNLTSITDTKEATIKHLLDSLSVYQLLEGETIADIGSGGGTPGIPLAIAFPKKKFLLVESKQKKAAFLVGAVKQLKLKNVRVINKRAEEVTATRAPETIISRALGSLDYFIDVAGHLLPKKGKAIAMKGKAEKFKLEKTSKNFQVLQTKKINVPYLDADRHAVCMIKRN
jgi:16S rRNA (guanine527-N7)-methyltransferase